MASSLWDWRPESESSFLYFSLCSIVARISASTSARALEKRLRELVIIASRLSVEAWGILSVVAEKAGAFSPLIIMEITK